MVTIGRREDWRFFPESAYTVVNAPLFPLARSARHLMIDVGAGLQQGGPIEVTNPLRNRKSTKGFVERWGTVGALSAGAVMTMGAVVRMGLPELGGLTGISAIVIWDESAQQKFILAVAHKEPTGFLGPIFLPILLPNIFSWDEVVGIRIAVQDDTDLQLLRVYVATHDGQTNPSFSGNWTVHFNGPSSVCAPLYGLIGIQQAIDGFGGLTSAQPGDVMKVSDVYFDRIGIDELLATQTFPIVDSFESQTWNVSLPAADGFESPTWATPPAPPPSLPAIDGFESPTWL